MNHMLLTQWAALLIADATSSGAPAQTGVMALLNNPIVPMILMLPAVYFIMIRPAAKQNRAQQDFLKSLKKDDEVVTSSGIVGRIVTVSDHIVTIEIASGVRMRMVRSHVASRFVAQGASSASAAIESSAKSA